MPSLPDWTFQLVEVQIAVEFKASLIEFEAFWLIVISDIVISERLVMETTIYNATRMANNLRLKIGTYSLLDSLCVRKRLHNFPHQIWQLCNACRTNLPIIK